jgi:hypothetical protein
LSTDWHIFRVRGVTASGRDLARGGAQLQGRRHPAHRHLPQPASG